MRLRSFTAPSMKEAMDAVKEALGEDALILASEETKSGVHITAAIDEDAASSSIRGEVRQGAFTETRNTAPTTPLPLMDRESDHLRYSVQHALRFHNVPELFIAKMIAKLNDAAIASILAKSRMPIANENKHFLKLALEHVCEAYFNFSPSPAMNNRLLLVGAPGIGKTLTLTKLATKSVLAGHKTALISTDVQRAGNAQQLQVFADILNIPLTICEDAQSLKITVERIAADTHLFIDTAGCSPYSSNELATLQELVRAARMPPVLVMQAGIDAQEAVDMVEAFMTMPVEHIICTRMDCTRRFGGLLAATAAHALTLTLEAASASASELLQPITPKSLAQALLKPL